MNKPFIGDYPITQTFKQHVDRKLPNYNGGIDYAIPEDKPIYAVLSGIVLRVEYQQSGYGHYIEIEHDDGLSTLYAHLKYVIVRARDIIRAGDMIGRSGNTGNSTGPHLHFEVRKNNIPIDPDSIGDEAKEERSRQPEYYGLVRVENLNIRSGIGVKNSIVGNVRSGCVFGVFAEAKDDTGNTWLDVGCGWCAGMYGGSIYVSKIGVSEKLEKIPYFPVENENQ